MKRIKILTSNQCPYYRKDTETCKLNGNVCPYEDDYKNCKLYKKKIK